jgi:DedD protein
VNSQIKQRVVGAIVLVALAVIFIPLLLTGKGELESRIDDGTVEPPELQLPPVPEAPEPPRLDNAAIVPLDQADEAAADAAPVPEPAAGIPPVEPAAAGAPLAAQPSGWVVQLGSFTSQKNALALRDSLRGKGYASFVEPITTGKDTAYRVRVGPELTPEAAERLKQKLAADLKMNGLVQQYP